ncbi:MAG: beta-galactosidase [Chloroflexi bacterium]|nr:beta-galactosidase [Chloroflexota bacterium]
MSQHPIRIGVCYYPEHWPEERWDSDARMMAELGLDCARIAEFAWSKMEPREGHFDFGWLERAVETLGRHGIDVILGTPTATPPRWLTSAYPDVLQRDRRGAVRGAGSRRHYCASSERYREFGRRIVEEMGRRFGRDSRVIGWQIDNEFGAHDTVRCFCDACDAGFRNWLRTRYESLDALNDTWGTVFWSGTFTNWDQVETPKFMPADPQPGHSLDYRRFTSDAWRDFQGEQVQILRALSPGRWITHNDMGWFGELDYYRLAGDLDFISWDNYVTETTPQHVASSHDLMRGLKRKPFWVMEQQMGKINWWRYNPAFAPGEIRSRTWQDIARGADGVVYFRWRQVSFGSEQYHSAILRNDATPSRGYEEIRALIAEVRAVEDRLAGTTTEALAAILHSYDDRWALELDPQTRDLEGFKALQESYFAAHRALWERNVTADIVASDASLDGYRLVLAPQMVIATAAMAERLTAWVEGGGLLILGPRAGSKTPENTTGGVLPPGPLTALCGATVEEYDAPPPSEPFAVTFADGAAVPARTWRDVLGARGAEVLALYSGGTFDGLPAVTVHRVGTGIVVLCGTYGGHDLWSAILDRVAAEIAPASSAPANVEVVRRTGNGKTVEFVINHNRETVAYEGRTLAPLGVVVR